MELALIGLRSASARAVYDFFAFTLALLDFPSHVLHVGGPAMQHATYSRCNYSGFAGKSHRNIPHLAENELGIVLTLDLKTRSRYGSVVSHIDSLSGLPSGLPPFGIRRTETIAHIPSLEISDLAFMYAQTYFDFVAYAVPGDPLFGSVHLQLTELQEKFYSQQATHLLPIVPEGAVSNLSSDGKSMFLDAGAFESFQNGCALEIDGLLQRDGPNWQLGNNLYGLQLNRQNSKGGLLFDLHNKLPIVADIDDAEGFLRWKDDRRSQRAALVKAINDFVGSIDSVDDETLRKKLIEIEVQCHDLVRVSKERFPRVVLRPVSFTFNYDFASKARLHGGIAGGFLGLLLGAPEIGAAAGGFGGHALGFRLKGGPTFAKSLIKDSPFASVVDLQYKP